MPIEVRPLTPTDAEALLDIRQRSLREEPLAFLSSPEDDLISSVEAARQSLDRAPEAVIFGAFAPELVGILGLFRAGHAKAAHKCFLWGMYLRPDACGQGTARRLLDAVIDHARGLDGVTMVGLSVSETAEPARRLYERAGFEVWGLEPQAMQVAGQYTREYHMGLSLTDG